MYHILTICQDAPVKKTHIMYRANLSHLLLQKYLDRLVTAQLLRAESPVYRTTDKGLRFIEAYEDLYRLLE